jgi:ABC-type lipoprotein export system ATPase subunit
MTEVLVYADGVSRVYGGGDSAVVAVREATFTIPAGARIALVGPSGSGKSTLLHLVAGVDRPAAAADRGRLAWPGLARPLRPGPIGIAFQGLSLLPDLDVTENVALPLLLAGAPEGPARSAAAAVLVDFGVDRLADRLPAQLSGGQAQRVALARAAVGNPRLILADEPTGQQDADGAHEVLTALLRHATRHAAALVVATHDDAVAQRFPVRWSMHQQTVHVDAEGPS